MNEITLEVTVVCKKEMNYKRRPQELKETYQEEDHGNPSYQNQNKVEEEVEEKVEEEDQEPDHCKAPNEEQNNVKEDVKRKC